MKRAIIRFIGAAAVVLAAVSAHAQTASTDRVFVSVNGGYRASSGDFRDGASFRASGEDGRFDTTYAVKAGPAFDIAAGVRVWRNLGVGVGLSRFSVDVPVGVTGSVPHPFFFNRARAVSGEVGGIQRAEDAAHIQLRGVFTFGGLQVSAFGGPSLVRLTQGIVTALDYVEQYPYDVTSIRQSSATITEVSGVGFHAGADLAYFFTRRLGVGFGAQTTSATLDVPSAAGGALSLKAGGLHAGGGLRLRF